MVARAAEVAAKSELNSEGLEHLEEADAEDAPEAPVIPTNSRGFAGVPFHVGIAPNDRADLRMLAENFNADPGYRAGGESGRRRGPFRIRPFRLAVILEPVLVIFDVARVDAAPLGDHILVGLGGLVDR